MEDVLALCALIGLHREHNLSFQQKENLGKKCHSVAWVLGNHLAALGMMVKEKSARCINDSSSH